MRIRARWMKVMAVAAVNGRQHHSIKRRQQHISPNIRRCNTHTMRRNSTPIHRQVVLTRIAGPVAAVTMQQTQVAARATTAYSINYTFQVDNKNKAKPNTGTLKMMLSL